MKRVDLNCDCGEGFGVYAMGDDTAMLGIVTSASVACGYHAGDPDIMANTFALARDRGVAIGAHPGFPDLAGFGRRRLPCSHEEIERMVAYQVGAAQAMAAYVGHRITYVKIHGALSNVAMEDPAGARAIAHAIKAVDPGLRFLAIAGTELEHAGEAAGLRTVREIYADRAYTDAGNLVSRALPGAVLHDPDEAAERVSTMIEEGAVITQSGKRIAVGIDSICVHGDTPGAVAMARAVRARLERAGIALKSFAA